MPQFVEGFNITAPVAVDERFTVSASEDRFGFLSGRVFDGLTVYATSSGEYFLMISKSKYEAEDSGSAYVKIITSEAGSDNVVIAGDLAINGVPNVSQSIASALDTAGTLQSVTDAGKTTTNAITASNGIAVGKISPMSGNSVNDSIAFGGLVANSAGLFKFFSTNLPTDGTIYSGGLWIQTGTSAPGSASPSAIDARDTNGFKLQVGGVDVTHIQDIGLDITGNITASNNISSSNVVGSNSRMESSRFRVNGYDDQEISISRLPNDYMLANARGLKIANTGSEPPSPTAGTLAVINGVLHVAITE